MNFPVWFLPETGGGLLIAIMAVTHVFVSHFAVGGGLYLVMTEHKARRENDDQLLEFVKKHAKFFMLLTMVFGGVTGVGIWFTIGLIQPDATSKLIHTFVFGWAAEWVWFLVEIIALIIYYYKFDSMDERTHLKVGWIYFAAAWLSLFLINGIIGFMLTPGEWVNNHQFFSGFFNPTFWPSLWFRFAISTLLAGVFAFFTTAFIDVEAFRLKMTRYSSLWCLLSLVVVIPTGYWYLQVLPSGPQEILSASPTIKAMVKLGAFSAAGFIVFLTLFTLIKPRWHNLVTAVLVAVCAFGMMGSFEWIREADRRPFVIREMLYSNGIPVDQVEQLSEGFLAQSKWSAIKVIDADNVQQAGAELFKLQCYACHTLDGINNDIRSRTATINFNGMVKYLGTMHQRRPFMPPFVGNELEKKALASYLVGTLHGKETHVFDEPELTINLGQKMLEDECTVCHGVDLVMDWGEFLSAEEVRSGLLNLSQIDSSMDDFSGTPEELAAVVATIKGQAAPAAPTELSGKSLLEEECSMCHGTDIIYDWAAPLSPDEVRHGLLTLSQIDSSMEDFSGTPQELAALVTALKGMMAQPSVSAQAILDDECSMCHSADLVIEWAAALNREGINHGLKHLSEINSSMDDFTGRDDDLEALTDYLVNSAKGGTQ
ncbi:cytochrome ubiquinol oxidase subunit I [Desulfuromonas acetoxidans]|uniref:Cytochrome bd-type quinol oxidase subunit 1-like n=1 Tax=Desulfuromonas acetoxidans (strain DSM 684 / 11070) TaxID=281689 RepID=Q1K0H2_DESA6|nr:cytochrome ubiquinol oxidase subunit I [Desulfuromonas acetoxidans]EAT15969.1 Cytochrome bd-type quinol oxidase subunit 1-like [Desulfuromonas acetoxidans DSM 684]MBF0644133.1 cytochrome ubiquinol oxidase subunit I [Desulfuromonas acetoxidans]NVD24569.1 cytochrome ubiquinol oxidase subunit I [Desulfuromonas acetoxidans]NVE16481.1 cytochrome ubiquinol oxidase subunit I [Desulfuromonas acetoxidans]